MKTLRWILITFSLVWSLAAMASGTRYVMRVDGLACPYCAYGVEKKFKKIEGVEKIDVDLDRGVVTVDVREGVRFTEPQMTALFKEAGFTFRGMKTEPR